MTIDVNTVALISLIVGMQALVLYFFQKAVEKVVVEKNEALRNSEKTRKYLSSFHENLVSCLYEMSASHRITSTLLVRLSRVNDMRIVDAISKELGDYDFSLEKSIYEISLFSNNHHKRKVAITALTESYGSLSSLSLMKVCSEEFLDGEDQAIKHGIKGLEMRLVSLLDKENSRGQRKL
jgi:hypothetical protein